MTRTGAQAASVQGDEAETSGISAGRKLLFGAVVVVGVLAAIELVLAVAGVGSIAINKDPYLGFAGGSKLFEPVPGDDGTVVLRTAPVKKHLFNTQSFAPRKGLNAYRIFTLGGSTTYGRPYDDRTSFTGWLRAFLQAADPSRTWEVINAGGISYASYRVARLMEELVEYEPDLFIVYTGHNEFLERRTYAGIIEEHPAVTRFNLLLHHSRLYSVMTAARRRFAPTRSEAAKKRYRMTGEVSTLLDTSSGLDLYARDDDLRRQILDHFRYNLGRMAEIARAAGADLVFVQPPANRKDFSPFKSQHRDGLGDERLAAWKGHVRRAAEAMGREDPSTAAEALTNAVAIDDRYAQTYYDLGRALLALGKQNEAGEAFARAVAEDIVPLRAVPEMYPIISEEGQRDGVPVIDFVSILTEHVRAKYGQTILGREVFLDHVHPTIAANRLLGRTLLDHLIAQGTARLDAAWSDAKAQSVADALLAGLDARAHAVADRNLARVLRWARKNAEADRLIARAAAILDDDADTFVLAGIRAMEDGNLDDAVSQFRRAIELRPRFGRAHNNLGTALLRRGETEAAIRHYTEAVRVDPELAPAHANLAKCLGNRGETREAIEHARAWLRLEPESAPGHNQLGELLLKVGKVEAAEASLATAVRLDDDNPRFLWNHAVALARGGRLDEAVTTARQAQALARAAGDAELAAEIQGRLKRYERNRKPEKP